LRVEGFGFWVWIMGIGIRVSELEFRNRVLALRVQGVGFRV
jgi:hypothetical protein